MRSHHVIKRVTARSTSLFRPEVVSCRNKQECRLKVTPEKNDIRLPGRMRAPGRPVSYSHNVFLSRQHRLPTHAMLSTALYQTPHGLIRSSFANKPRYTLRYQHSDVFETTVHIPTQNNCSKKCMEMWRQFLDKHRKNYRHLSSK